MSLADVVEEVRGGKDPADFATALRDNPRLELYRDVDALFHARHGEKLDMHISVPLAGGRLVLGELDGDSGDVDDASIRNDMTGHLSYIGPRYNRDFRFVLEASTSECHGFRVTFHVMDVLDREGLPKSNVPGRLEEYRLIYDVTGPVLMLDYGEMGWSLEKFLRGRAWYPVDKIVFECL